ncbi:MAG: C-GCAxxG-C-C family protein [Bacteroides sp.]|nr:C-GCAxxG-C-C family protein [Bacteroides sp.]MDD2645045.1 C-GCAxxG-C-C family protein [Bacteroides sp.]MDD4055320.1 C-GCAxxG-C-C family protein [Bacteroides sp.]MDD4719650.1 C-GCAxxG-C-C family protein [Bacteroides sp.]
MREEEKEKRVKHAVELFEKGFNCSQSVFAAFCDRYGYTEEQGLILSASFGGGIGRMRETCGAACGLFMIASLETGSSKPGDREGKARNYKVVQELAQLFIAKNGALRCADLLGIEKPNMGDTNPEKRTSAYYKKRPCKKIVEDAARIVADTFE